MRRAWLTLPDEVRFAIRAVSGLRAWLLRLDSAELLIQATECVVAAWEREHALDATSTRELPHGAVRVPLIGPPRPLVATTMQRVMRCYGTMDEAVRVLREGRVMYALRHRW